MTPARPLLHLSRPAVALLLAATLGWAASPATAKQYPSPAAELLAKSIEYHDPAGLWAGGAFDFRFTETRPNGPDRLSHVVIDNRRSRFVLEREQEGRQVHRSLDGGQCTFLVDGSAEVEPELAETLRLDCDRLTMLRNYYSYLWGLPMKLRDPGTQLDPEVIETTFDGRDVLGVRVTYEPEVGKDIWYFYFDPESSALVGYRFYHDEAANDGEYILLDGEIELATEAGRLRLPAQRTWFTHQGDRLLGTDSATAIKALD